MILNALGSPTRIVGQLVLRTNGISNAEHRSCQERRTCVGLSRRGKSSKKSECIRAFQLPSAILKDKHFISRCSPAAANYRYNQLRATELQTAETQGSNFGHTVPQESWTAFSDAINGEWDGYGADFSSSGEPQELPESVVPQTFRDWELQVFDWQMQGPTLANIENRLYSKTIRLLPTVGCEADAATQYSIEEKNAGQGTNAGTLLFTEEGSYVVAWPGHGAVSESIGYNTASKVVRRMVETDDKLGLWELEHCLVADEPRANGCSDQKAKARVRVLQQFEGGIQDGKVPKLKGVTVYRERWEGEFRNGESLGGCGASSTGFAERPRTDKGAVEGRWQADSRLYSGGILTHGHFGLKGALVALAPAESQVVDRVVTEETLLLPKGVWSEIRVIGDNMVITAGWLVDSGRAVVSKCSYSMAPGELQLQAVEISQERR